MNSATPEKVSEETPSALDSAVIAEKETNAQRLLSFIARLTSNSIDELDKAIAELERLQVGPRERDRQRRHKWPASRLDLGRRHRQWVDAWHRGRICSCPSLFPTGFAEARDY